MWEGVSACGRRACLGLFGGWGVNGTPVLRLREPGPSPWRVEWEPLRGGAEPVTLWADPDYQAGERAASCSLMRCWSPHGVGVRHRRLGRSTSSPEQACGPGLPAGGW